jgi:hypothetical protein
MSVKPIQLLRQKGGAWKRIMKSVVPKEKMSVFSAR